MGYGFQHFGGGEYVLDALLYRNGGLICDCIVFVEPTSPRSQSLLIAKVTSIKSINTPVNNQRPVMMRHHHHAVSS